MDVTCPDCGGELILKRGARGEFWGCRRFPDCRGTREVEDKPAPNDQDAASIPLTGIENNGTFLSEIVGELRSLRIAVDRLTDAVSWDGANNDLNLLRHAAYSIADELRIHNQLQWLLWEKTYGRKPTGDA